MKPHTMMLPLAVLCIGLAAFCYWSGGPVGLICAGLNLVFAGMNIGGWYQSR